MSQWRVYYQHRGQTVSTVLAGETEGEARAAFGHHHPRVPIERVQPVGRALAVVPRAAVPATEVAARADVPAGAAAAADDARRRAPEGEMRRVAQGLRTLRGQLAEHARTPEQAATAARCPECGGPAERTWGSRRGWRVRPLGCGHGIAHPGSPEVDEQRARALAALAALPAARPPEDFLPSPTVQQVA